MEQTKKAKIKIIKDGPYHVTGGVILRERIITPKGEGYVMEDGRELPQAESYYLCRCGKSKNPPFCDGAHKRENFSGTETAARTPYAQRARKLAGPGIDLYDDNRCAYARFCHRESGTAWALALRSDDPES